MFNDNITTQQKYIDMFTDNITTQQKTLLYSKPHVNFQKK